MSNIKKVALLGPIAPYRGGIAQYTTFLKRALSEVCNLQTISFKRQYPKFLYPGESDIDPFSNGRDPEVNYLLDALNPFSLIKAANHIIKSEADLAILTWWTLFWAPGFAIIAFLVRRKKIPVIFLCHNLADHGAKGLKKTIIEFLLSSADGYIVHSNEHKDFLKSNYPEKPVLKIHIPSYEEFPEPKGLLRKRGRLELLFFGFIRPYKGLDILMQALSKLDDPEVYLTVAGETWEDKDFLYNLVKNLHLKNVELHLSYTKEEELAEFFGRADVAILPYRSASGSAVAAVAYRYDCPIIATRVGGLVDIVLDGETGYLVEPESSTSIAEKLKNLSRKDLAHMKGAIRNFKKELTWESVAEKIIKFERELAK
ncbi:glycosyltransferase [Leptospira selangorensis]|uniref:Glycosyltransferase n=1 Tax=Leptospira selangorensis TaxID=2484982 RepID=A0A5F2BVT8_9LEPT|nr:glycosyltransferase [Leptospira selangorensis]TGM11969.1 glycosyltransferase [Leptospira selangorensis]TGM15170.1 glycosyltransferase [Leptospira selangorensis]